MTDSGYLMRFLRSDRALWLWISLPVALFAANLWLTLPEWAYENADGQFAAWAREICRSDR